jgi:hypothetical protein
MRSPPGFQTGGRPDSKVPRTRTPFKTTTTTNVLNRRRARLAGRRRQVVGVVDLEWETA